MKNGKPKESSFINTLVVEYSGTVVVPYHEELENMV